MEKILKPISGFLALLLSLVCLALSILSFAHAQESGWFVAFGILLALAFLILVKGLLIVQPNYSSVLNFFGKYAGTVKENGLFFLNPLFTKTKISLRAENLQGQVLKVNDKMGNPIEIAAVIVWQVGDTYKAAYEVSDYASYIKTQSEAAVRHLASSFSYDNLEDEKAEITLRDGGEKMNELLVQELNNRMEKAGITILEARISHLAYAAEIAGAMLQRQQATAIVAARIKIVEGAVGMVEMALQKLSEREIVQLDNEKKAAMVSNLMVVLCGEKAPSPVLNTGTLYQ